MWFSARSFTIPLLDFEPHLAVCVFMTDQSARHFCMAPCIDLTSCGQVRIRSKRLDTDSYGVVCFFTYSTVLGGYLESTVFQSHTNGRNSTSPTSLYEPYHIDVYGYSKGSLLVNTAHSKHTKQWRAVDALSYCVHFLF